MNNGESLRPVKGIFNSKEKARKITYGDWSNHIDDGSPSCISFGSMMKGQLSGDYIGDKTEDSNI